MKFTAFFVSFVTAATFASARTCAESDRFGDLSVSPTTVSAGDTLNISTDLTCALNFDIVAQFLDYTIEVLAPNNNGFELPIVLARRAIQPGALSDSFSVTVPHAFFFANADYSVVVTTTYAVNGSDGNPFLQEGGTDVPITINV